MYTKEQLEFIREEYNESPSRETIEFLAKKFDTSIRSIASRLSAMGIYKKLGYTTKSGEKPVAKNLIIEYIADALKVPSATLDGLEKAPKKALRLILKALDGNSDRHFKI